MTDPMIVVVDVQVTDDDTLFAVVIVVVLFLST